MSRAAGGHVAEGVDVGHHVVPELPLVARRPGRSRCRRGGPAAPRAVRVGCAATCRRRRAGPVRPRPRRARARAAARCGTCGRGPHRSAIALRGVPADERVVVQLVGVGHGASGAASLSDPLMSTGVRRARLLDDFVDRPPSAPGRRRPNGRTDRSAGTGRSPFYVFARGPARPPAPARPACPIQEGGRPPARRAGTFTEDTAMFRRWMLGAALLRRAVRGRPDLGQRRRPPAAPRVLLPVLVLPPQLLAGVQPAVAGAPGGPVHAAAGLHGLPGLQGAELAVRPVGPEEVLPRVPLLARPVLSQGSGVRSQESGRPE